jgi:RNA-directed DNA polymerase
MKQKHPHNPWERYADDAVIHCRTEEEAKALLVQLDKRMAECRLELHPQKTKIIYCRSDVNPEHHEHESFDFLSETYCKE